MENKIGKIFFVIGMLTICSGLIASFIVGNEYKFIFGLITFICSFVSGVLFIGFGEVIFLLQENLNSNRNTARHIVSGIETDELPEI